MVVTRTDDADERPLAGVPGAVILGAPLRNRARCLACGEVVESHGELAACACGATICDGGASLYRRAWTLRANGARPFTDLNDSDGVNPYPVVLAARRHRSRA